MEALAKIEAGGVTPVKQNDGESCYAKMLHKSMGKIDWNMEAKKLDCFGFASKAVSPCPPKALETASSFSETTSSRQIFRF